MEQQMADPSVEALNAAFEARIAAGEPDDDRTEVRGIDSTRHNSQATTAPTTTMVAMV